MTPSTQPLLSIITPALNAERYLRGFIQAVIDQRCPDIEHVFIDGGSSDNSLKIIKEFSQKYPHIRWISEKDAGSAEAINKGIALVRAEFMTVLCLNDFYQPDTLNEVVNLLPTLAQPAFLVGNCNILNEKDELRYVNKPEALTPMRILMKKPFPYNPSAYFYHKDLHQKAGLYRNCDCFDLDFLLRAFKVAKVRYVDKCWGNFRMLPDSITVKARRAGTLDMMQDEIFSWYLKDYSIFQRLLIKIVRALNKWPKLIYFLERIVHYLRDPKDVVRYLSSFVQKRSKIQENKTKI